MAKTIFTVVVFLVFIDILSANYKNEKTILKKILSDYNADVRPEIETRKSMEVHFDMRLKKIVSVNIKDQVLKIDAFTILRWKDPQLTWNSTLYNDTDRVNIGNTHIWTPDVVLYNTADDISRLHTDIYTSKCLVFSDGNVIMRNLVTWRVSCTFDVTWFPVDKQVCNISFGSWSYSVSQLKVMFFKKPTSKDELFSSSFRVDSGEWMINNLNSYSDNIQFSCCPESFSSITYELVVSRVSLYYFMYILLPLISLAFLFLLIFHIPVDSGERMGFGVTILLSITVYLLVISEKLPEKSDKIPMLGLCFIVIFYILCTALALSAVTTMLSRRSTPPPYWLVKLTQIGCFKKNEHPIVPLQGSVQVKSLSVETMETTLEDRNGKNNNDDICHSENNFQKPHKTPCRQSTPQDVDYHAEWVKICRIIDQKMFFVYIFIILIIPILVTSSLPKDALGQS